MPSLATKRIRGRRGMDAGIEPNILRPKAHAGEGARQYCERLQARIDAAEQAAA